MCSDYGKSEVQGASLLAAMGIFDLIGTTASGWLSDRYDSRVLLFWYYGLRGLSLIYLPHAFGIDFFGLPVFYGLDWIATVPPTVCAWPPTSGPRIARRSCSAGSSPATSSARGLRHARHRPAAREPGYLHAGLDDLGRACASSAR